MAQSLESLLTLKNALDSEMYNTKHYRRAKERELAACMASLANLQQREREVHVAARRMPNAQKWVGLTGLTGFYGTLMYCVWDVYSWDVMEPITYFIGFTAVLGNSFYSTITKKVRVAAQPVLRVLVRLCFCGHCQRASCCVFFVLFCVALVVAAGGGRGRVCRTQPIAIFGRNGMPSACTC